MNIKDRTKDEDGTLKEKKLLRLIKRRAHIQRFKKENRTFLSFSSARGRCNNPKNKAYPYYGKRGIKCKFTSYRQIIENIGTRPQGMTLERIDNNGHYEKGNVRWASMKDQARNKRNNVLDLNKVSLAREMFKNGKRLYEISLFLFVDRTTLADAIYRRTWNE